MRRKLSLLGKGELRNSYFKTPSAGSNIIESSNQSIMKHVCASSKFTVHNNNNKKILTAGRYIKKRSDKLGTTANERINNGPLEIGLDN